MHHFSGRRGPTGSFAARAIGAFVAVSIAVTALAGCASSGSAGAGGTSSLRLQDVKSPVQLLRNQAAGRIDTATIDHALSPSDTADSCRDPRTDPQHKWLTWKSTVQLFLTYSASSDMASAREALAQSFVKQGWTEKPGDAIASIDLSRESSVATLTIYTTDRMSRGEQGGTITIVAAGPCIETPGAASEEVRQLIQQAQH